MSDLVRRQSEMAVKVKNFGTENVALYQSSAKAVAAFAVVSNGVDQLEGLGALKASAAETKFTFSDRRKSFRGQLYTTLTDIARTARQIARENPDFINKFKAPQDNRNDSVLLDSARGFADDLPPVKQLFLDYAEDEDFIEELIEETDDFAASISGQDTSNRQRIGANASIDDVLDEILAAVQTLKVIMPKLLKDNPDKLAQWLSACHIERPPKKKKTNEPTP